MVSIGSNSASPTDTEDQQQQQQQQLNNAREEPGAMFLQSTIICFLPRLDHPVSPMLSICNQGNNSLDYASRLAQTAETIHAIASQFPPTARGAGAAIDDRSQARQWSPTRTDHLVVELEENDVAIHDLCGRHESIASVALAAILRCTAPAIDDEPRISCPAASACPPS